MTVDPKRTSSSSSAAPSWPSAPPSTGRTRVWIDEPFMKTRCVPSADRSAEKKLATGDSAAYCATRSSERACHTLTDFVSGQYAMTWLPSGDHLHV